MNMLIFSAFFIIFLWLFNLNNKVYRISTSLEQLSAPKKKARTAKAEAGKTEEKTYSKPVVQTPVIKQTAAFDFENLFLGNIFNKIGAIALIIGVAVFIKLVSPYLSMSPVIKIASGYLLGIIILGLSQKLNRTNYQNYANVLTGTGLGILFVATWFASAYYKLFSVNFAAFVSGLLTFLGWFFADRHNSKSILIIALIAGYLNPFFSACDKISAGFLFGYFIFINLLSITFSLRKQSLSMLNIFNLLFSSAIISIYTLFDESIKDISLLYPFLLWAAYLAYDQIRLHLFSEPKDNDNNDILGWLNMVIFVIFGRLILTENRSFGLFCATLAAVYLVLSLICGKQRPKVFLPYLYSAIITATLSLYELTSGTYTLAAWMLEALLIIVLAQRFNLSKLIGWSVPITILAITKIFTTPQATYYLSSDFYTPVLNFRAGLYGIPFAGSLIAWLLLRKKTPKIADFYKFAAISLLYAFTSFEISMSILKYLSHQNVSYAYISFTRQMTWCFIGFIYAVQIFRLHKATGFWLAGITSNLIYYICLIYLLLYGNKTPDLHAYIPILNIRFLTYATCITASALQARWQKNNLHIYIAVILGFILINTETTEIIRKFKLFSVRKAAISILWTLYAAGLIFAGILHQQPALKKSGIWIALAAVGKVFFWDLSSMAPIYKTAAFLILGSTMLIISYIYTKHKTKE